MHEGCTDDTSWKRGPKRPYIGSLTKIRAKKAPLQVVEVSKLHDTLLTLLSLIPWVKSDTGLHNLFSETIYAIKAGQGDKEIFQQIDMANRNAGMKDLELMKEFIQTGTSKALLVASVLRQAEKFLDAYQKFINDNPVD